MVSRLPKEVGAWLAPAAGEGEDGGFARPAQLGRDYLYPAPVADFALLCPRSCFQLQGQLILHPSHLPSRPRQMLAARWVSHRCQ